ncbi:MAG: hypothetical protein V3T58_00020 [Candidatus Hydrothermarchaeales archaeon]
MAAKTQKRNALPKIAEKLFAAGGKKPYHLGDRAIKNFGELKDNLDLFSSGDANWLASWIEYLGDPKTAEKIRDSSDEFKKIILKRYEQLQKYRK